jgi:hypothetical protein
VDAQLEARCGDGARKPACGGGGRCRMREVEEGMGDDEGAVVRDLAARGWEPLATPEPEPEPEPWSGPAVP